MNSRSVILVQTQAENGGAQEIARILASHFSAEGVSAHHLFFYRRTKAFDNEPNTFFCANSRPRSFWAFLKLFLRMLTILRQEKPDTVLTFQHYGNILGAISARITGINHIIATQTSAPLTTPKFARWIDKWLGHLGIYSSIVVNSNETLHDYAMWPKEYRKRMVKIEHGFSTRSTSISVQQARHTLGIKVPGDLILLGCAARLHPLKNLGAAIRLLSHDPRWHLALAGQGKEKNALEQLARELNVEDRIFFLGEIPPEIIGIFLRTLDVFVFPTLAETFGLAAVEAAEAGIPVIANDLPVLRDVLKDHDGNPCAIFVNTADTAAFAAQTTELLKNEALKAYIRQNARSLSQRYSSHVMASHYLDLINHRTNPPENQQWDKLLSRETHHAH